MSSDPTENQSLHLAKQLNAETWAMLEKPARTGQEDELMVHAAHASCYHWLRVGTGLNHQRGEWLIARVYSQVGLGDSSLRHATRCLQLTEEHANLMHDFDRAYAYEAMARAHATVGDRDEALAFLQLAEEFGLAIDDETDRSIFVEDLRGGKWYGVR